MKIKDFFSQNMFFIALLIVSICILYFTFSYNNNVGKIVNAALVGEMCGNFIVIFIVWVLGCYLLNMLVSSFNKKINIYQIGTSKCALLLIFIFIEISYLYPLFLEQKSVNSAADSLINTITTLDKQEQRAPSKTTYSGAPAVDKQVILMNEMNQVVITVNKKYEAALSSIAIKNDELSKKMAIYFTPENLTTMDGINNAKAFVSEYRLFVAERGNILAAYQNDLTSEVIKYNIQDKEFWSSFNSSKADTKNLIDSLTNTDNQMLDSMQGILEFIERNLVHAKIVSNSIQFDDQSLNDQYKLLLTSFLSLANKEGEILTKIQNSKVKAVNEIQSLKQ